MLSVCDLFIIVYIVVTFEIIEVFFYNFSIDFYSRPLCSIFTHGGNFGSLTGSSDIFLKQDTQLVLSLIFFQPKDYADNIFVKVKTNYGKLYKSDLKGS